MVYLIKINDNKIGTYFSEDTVKMSGYDIADAIKVTEEDFNACGGSSYISNGRIYLGLDPVTKIKVQIRNLKKFLADTDYVDNKIVEGDATIDDYREVIEQRKAARREIDKLER